MDAQGGVNQVVKTGQITDSDRMFNHLASIIYEKYTQIGVELGLKQNYLYNELETGMFNMKKGSEKALKMLQLWQQSVDDAHFTYSALAAALEQHGHKRAALKFCYTEASSNLQSKPQKCVETCGAPTVNSGNNPSLAIASEYPVKGCLSINNLSEVFEKLYIARTKWYNIGLGLHMNSTDLDAIKMKLRDDADKCFRELLSTWLKQKNTTWDDLDKALKSPTVGFEELSETVQNRHLSHAHASTETLENTDTPQLEGTDSQRPQCTFSPQPKSTDSSRPDSPRMKPHHKKGKETEQFQCPCGNNCDLIDYLDKKCPVSSSSSYPYLDVNKLSDDDREDLFQRLNDDTADIIQCFADLLSSTSESLRRRHITLERLIEVSLDLGVYKSGRNQIPLLEEDQAKLKETTSFGSAFNILRDHMSFFNYELLSHIIRHLGEDNDKKKFEVFCSQFKNYCKRKVFEVPAGPAVLHPSGSERSSRIKFVVVATPDLINTLADVKAAQRKIASLLRLRASTVQLERIDIGCVILVFSIPRTLNNLFPLKAATCAELKSGGFSLIVPNKPTDQALNAHPKSLKKAFPPQHVPFEPFGKDRKVEFQISSETERMEIEIDQDIKIVSSQTESLSTNEVAVVTNYELQQNLETIDLNQIEKKFSTLLADIKRSFKDNHMSVQTIASNAIRFGVTDSDEQNLRKESSLDRLFDFLTRYWSFLDYDMLEIIVQNCGTDTDFKRMEKYKEALEIFCSTQLSELTQEKIVLSNDQTRQQIVITLNVSDLTFKEIMDLKIKLCTILNVESHTLQMVQICKHKDEHYVEINFLTLDYNSAILHSEGLNGYQCDSLVKLSVTFLACSFKILHNINNLNLIVLCRDVNSSIGQVADIIINGEANVNYQDKLGFTPLHYASMIGRADVVKFLISNGANVKAASTDDFGSTPLHCASRYGHSEVAEILLNNGAEVDPKSSEKCLCETPLGIACIFGHKTTVQLLIQKHANINYQNTDGWTPLHYASRNKNIDNNIDVVEILLNSSAEVDPILKEGGRCVTPLILACCFGYKATVELLLRKQANVNYQDMFGYTPLHYVCESGNTEFLKLLIKWNAQIDVPAKNGKTALMLACSYGHTLLVQLLIKNGANINYQNELGLVALHYAIANGHTEIVKILLDHNADTNVTTEHGDSSPLCYAVQSGNITIVEMLIQNKTNVDPPQEEGGKCESALTLACQDEHDIVDIAQLLIGKGANLDHQNTFGCTPLHIASAKGNTHITIMLINAGARIDIPAKGKREAYGATALILACKGGHKAIADLLIKNGAFVNYQDELGYTPLHFSSINGHTEVAEVLINAGAHVNIATADSKCRTALTFACQEGHVAIAKLLIHEGAFLDYQDKFGFTPLHLASFNGHVDVVEILIHAGAQINITGMTDKSYCDTALTLACIKGHEAIARLLVNRKADVNHKNKLNFTPLHYASLGGYTQLVKLLIDSGAQGNIPTKEEEGTKCTALTLASEKGHKSVIELLILNGSNVHYKDMHGFTSLDLASINGHLEAAEVLIHHGAQVTTQTKDGVSTISPLLLASLNGHTAVAELLIDKGANVNFKNKVGTELMEFASQNGYSEVVKLITDIQNSGQDEVPEIHITALMLACLCGHEDLTKLLLHKGANLNSKDKDGRTALSIACWHGNKEIAELLLRSGAKSNIQDKDGFTCLILAAQNGHTDVVKTLLKSGIDPNVTDKKQWSSLFFAAKLGNIELVQTLLDANAKVDLKDLNGATAYDVAQLQGHSELCELLREQSLRIHKPLTQITEDQKQQLRSTIEEQENVFFLLGMTLGLLIAAAQESESNQQTSNVKGHFDRMHHVLELSQLTDAKISSERLSKMYSDPEDIHVHIPDDTIPQHQRLGELFNTQFYSS